MTLSSKGEALIRAGRAAYQPTPADRERLLQQLRARLGDAALPSGAGAAASTVTVGSSSWPLLSAIVLGVGILGGAVYYAWPRHPAPETPPAVTEPAPAPTVAAPAVAPAASAPTMAATPTAPPAATATAGTHTQDRLAAEVALLARATRDLRAGRPAEALRALDEYRHKFPRGMLGEEQTAARAQALCALDRFGEAGAKLAELPPRSPLAVRAQQFCDARSRR